MKILLPVDGSPYTKHMLSYAAEHDELLGSKHEYLILTVVTSIPAHASRYVNRDTVDDYYKEQAELVLTPVRKFTEEAGWKATFKHVHGHAAECIAAYAKAQNVDLIVLGSHGHSALGNMLLGSVASGVLARCTIPVLLIR